MAKHLTPLKIALLYVAFSALWVVAFDYLLAFNLDNTVLQTQLTLGKEWGFIILSTGLLYFVLQSWHKNLLAAQANRHNALNLTQALTDAAPDAVISFDPAGKILTWNRQAEIIFGYSLAQVIGCEITELIFPPFYRDIHRAGIAEFIESGKQTILGKHLEIIGINQNGKEFPIELTLLSLTEHNQPFFVATIRDISICKKIESELRHNEFVFRTFVSMSSQAIWRYQVDNTPTNRIHLVNPSWWYEFTGQTEQEHTANNGMGWLSAVHEEDRRIAERTCSHILLSTEPITAEYRVRRQDGNWRWLQVQGVPIQNQQTLITEWIGTITDITERKIAEQQLVESEFKLATIMENVNAYIYLKDCQGRYTFVNRLCLELWELPIEEVIGLTDADLFEPNLAAVIQEHDRIVLLHGKAVSYDEEGITLKSHKVGQYFATKIPMRDTNGTIYGLCGISTDITEHKKQDALIYASQAKLKAALDSMSDAVFISDTEGHFIEFNEAFATFHKFKNKAECPKILAYYPNFIEVYSSTGEFVPLEQRTVPRALRGEEGTGLEFFLKRIDTGETWIGSYNYAPIRNTDGEIIGSVVTARDITQSKKAAEEILSSKAKLEAALDSMNNAVFISDCEGQLIEFNDAFAAFHKFKNKEECATTLAEYPTIFNVRNIKGELLPLQQWAIPRALGGEKATNVEFILQRKDTNESWIGSYNYAPIRNSNGAIVGSVVTARDITEQKNIENVLIASEKEFRLLADSMPQIVWIANIKGECFYLNQQWVDYTGLSLEESYRNNWYKCIHPDDQQGAWDAWQHALNNKTSYSFECRICSCDGVYRWWLDRGVPVFDEHGNVYKWFGTCTDIHDIKETEKALYEKQRLLADSQGIAHVGSWVINILEKTVTWSEETFRLYGLSPSTDKTPSHKQFLELLHPDDVLRMQDWSAACRSGKQPASLEFRTRPINGDYRWLLGNAILETDSNGNPVKIIGTVQDITARKKAEETIFDLAYYDPLTRLPNRRLMLDRLQHTLISRALKKRHGAILFINLDNFRTLNESKGHGMGDLLLVEVTQHLQEIVHKDDTVARIGSDEFVLVLDGLKEATDLAALHAESVAKRVLASINQPFNLQNYEYRCSACIGITLFCGNELSVDELIKHADIAMHQAKQNGSNSICFFDSTVQATLEYRVQLEAWMHKALHEQYQLYYQVQVNEQGKATGAESLIRWLHPEHGLISPASFIPLAEETGLILPIGQWVLETACAQLKVWEDNPHTQNLVIAVNVSAKQFGQQSFVEQVLDILKESGANPDRLKLELTESMLVNNVDDIIEKMNALKNTGVKFSLDDFGTGFSSLTYLKRLPLNQLKIDQSFVRDALTNSNDAAIIRTIIALGESLEMEVIAEGVETELQREFLAAHGCHNYQGYLFSKPLPVKEFEQLLRKLE